MRFLSILFLFISTANAVDMVPYSLSNTAGDTRYVNSPTESVAQTFSGAVTLTSSLTVTVTLLNR